MNIAFQKQSPFLLFVYEKAQSSSGRGDVFALCIFGEKSELLLYVTVELPTSLFVLCYFHSLAHK